MKELILCTSMLVLLFSCKENNTEIVKKNVAHHPIEKNKIEKESHLITGNDFYFLFSEDRKDSSELTLDYSYYSLLENRKCSFLYQDTVNQLTADFVDAISNMSRERIRPIFSVNIFKKSLPLFASFYEELIKEETDEMMLWDINSEIAINDSFPNYVQLTTSSWSYTGGAHGNGFIIYTLVAKEDGHDMKLNEFCSDIKKLNQLAIKKLKVERELAPDQPISDAGFWIEDESNFLNENFYFKDGGIIFHFNPYEIASYADGHIEILISKDELEGIINE